MVNRKNKNSSVPASIQLLFNNEKLDLMKVLCLMNAFSNNSMKQRKVSEVLFYYSLVNFHLINLFNSDIKKLNRFTPSPNMHFRFQTKFNEILLIMSQLHFLELNGDTSRKIEDIKIKLLPEGKQFFEQHNSEYFRTLQNKYLSAFDEVRFSAENVKVIKGMQK